MAITDKQLKELFAVFGIGSDPRPELPAAFRTFTRSELETAWRFQCVLGYQGEHPAYPATFERLADYHNSGFESFRQEMIRVMGVVEAHNPPAAPSPILPDSLRKAHTDEMKTILSAVFDEARKLLCEASAVPDEVRDARRFTITHLWENVWLALHDYRREGAK